MTFSDRAKWRWTDALVEPLRSQLADGRWSRLEEAKKGGWIARGSPDDGPLRWFSVTDGGGFEALPVTSDRHLPQIVDLFGEWLIEEHSVELIAHRVSRRAVFRLRGAHGERIVKVYRKPRQIPVRWRHLADRDGEWRVPKVLDWDESRRTLATTVCPGESLHSRWRTGQAQAEDGDTIADLLAWLRGIEVDAEFPVHKPDDEIRILSERLPVFERLLADPPSRARAVTARVLGALAEEPIGVRLTSHRDLHDKQILVGDGTRSLIDLDLCAGAPVALDCGNIIAHTRLRALQGFELPWQEIVTRITRPHLQRHGGRLSAAGLRPR